MLNYIIYKLLLCRIFNKMLLYRTILLSYYYNNINKKLQSINVLAM